MAVFPSFRGKGVLVLPYSLIPGTVPMGIHQQRSLWKDGRGENIYSTGIITRKESPSFTPEPGLSPSPTVWGLSQAF